MDHDLYIKDKIVIPSNEIEIITSRSGGPGGQHVNKINTKVTVKWNVKSSSVLNDSQKYIISKKLENKLSKDGELIFYSSSSRSQLQNKKLALDKLVTEVRKALTCSKKRMKTRVPKSVKEERLKIKTKRSYLKKLRKKVGED